MTIWGPSSEFFIPEKGTKVDGHRMGETKCDSNEDPDPGLCVSSGRSSGLAPGSQPGVPELLESLVDSASP